MARRIFVEATTLNIICGRFLLIQSRSEGFYIYRETSLSAGATNYVFYVDGARVAEVENGDYAYFNIDPGRYSFELKIYCKGPESGVRSKFSFNVKAGQQVYIRCMGGASCELSDQQLGQRFVLSHPPAIEHDWMNSKMLCNFFR